jgi:hypothetical protein
MTEGERQSATDPHAMLDFFRGRAEDRKLRLFACACLRRAWPLLPDEESRNAVVVAERFAEGKGSAEELAAAREAARNGVWDAARGDAREAAVRSASGGACAHGWAVTGMSAVR